MRFSYARPAWAHVLLQFFLLFIILSQLLACHPETANKTHITNGREISRSNFPEVVQIRTPLDDRMWASCTATVVSPVGETVTVVSAVHCVDSVIGKDDDAKGFLTTDKITLAGWELKSKKIYFPKGAVAGNAVNGDFVVIVFAKDERVKDSAAISKNLPHLGDAVTLVGYGCNHEFFATPDKNPLKPDCSGSGPKRIATNTIASFGVGSITLDSLAGPSADPTMRGKDGGTGSGDSGGPLFNQNNDIIGIVSGGLLNTTGERQSSVYLNIFAHAPQEVLARAAGEGVTIRGISTNAGSDDDGGTNTDPMEEPAEGGVLDYRLELLTENVSFCVKNNSSVSLRARDDSEWDFGYTDTQEIVAVFSCLQKGG